MTATRSADPSFGINPQALAVLQLLAGTEPSFADFDPVTRSFNVEIRTYPWYNGFEHGVALVVQKNLLGPGVIITFGENRLSDHLFVEHWMADEIPANGPTVDNSSEDKHCRALFKHGRFDEVISYISDVMSEFYERVSAPPLARVQEDRSL